MLDSAGDINWLAVAAAAVAYYVLGGLWFTPLFGRAWDRSVGFQRPPKHKFPPIYYVAPLIGSIVATIATAVLSYALEIEQLSEAALLGLVVGVGYAAAVSFTNAVSPSMKHPLLFAAVTGSYHAAGLILASVIIALLK